MNFYFLASLIVLLLVFGRVLKKSTFQMQQDAEDFWAKEALANSVRKKPLDNLNYITIPVDTLPIQLYNDNPHVQECINTVMELAQNKIVNLTGITNTDLKLAYGTANITILSQYDQNYTFLVTALQKWADLLYELNEPEAVKTILEFSVSTGCDITKTYLTLAEIYDNRQEPENITSLMATAKTLSSPSGKIICRRLAEEYPGLFTPAEE